MTSQPIGLVSVARCAALLTELGDPIERSALSRYCDTHALKRGKAGREVLVDFEEVRAHRTGNYQREVMGGDPAPVIAPPLADLVAAAESAPSAAVVPIPPRDDPSRALKEIQLRQAQRQELLEEGQLTHAASVDAGVAEAIVEMRKAFAAERDRMAEHLTAELGVPPEKGRHVRAALKRYDRIGQERFAEAMAKLLALGNSGDTDVRERLAALVAYAEQLRGGEIEPAELSA